jgi:general secretion pathway protein G
MKTHTDVTAKYGTTALLKKCILAGLTVAQKLGKFKPSEQGRQHPLRRSGELGYTLVEMLVVLAIIGLVVGLVGPRVLNYLSDSKVKTARIQIDGLSSALDLYYLDNGAYPASNDGLAALVTKPSGATNWNGPYLKSISVPNDPWGKPYVYAAPGQHGPYDIMSLGPEGREGGTGAAAAITSWQR